MSAPAVEALLRARFGLETSLLGSATVDAILHRMAAEAGLAASAYAATLGESPVALQAFVEAVAVHETWFLRDGGPFEFLVSEAHGWRRTRWAEAPRLRVLCLACATGEEAWSLAMALREAGLGAHDFVIEAFDLSETALDKARTGVYAARAFRSPLAESWRDRWCEPVAGGFRVREELRHSVRFERANLMDPRWVEGLAPAHLICCRNVLIYFGQEARSRMLDRLAALLVDDGVLFTGHAEAVLMSGNFRCVGPLNAFAFSHRAVESPRKPAPAADPKTRDAPRNPAYPAAQTPMRSSTAPPLDELAQASELADTGHYREALLRVERVLMRDRANTRAWLLKGMAETALGEAREASVSLGKVLYLDPVNEVALLAMARLETLAGHTDRARLLRERAARAGAEAGQ